MSTVELSFSGLNEPLNLRNVDEMASILLNLATEHPAQSHAVVNTAKDIVTRLDYSKISC